MKGSALSTLTALVLVLILAPMAHAQATRTWVSGVGDDANPCSRTAPCKTFAGAISKTATFGEISVLDPGGFGVVTITKAITLSGDGTLAGILSASTNGIIVNITAPASDGPVVLRNLSINGANTGLNGIRYLAGKQVVVQNCTISGVTGNGIDVSLAADGNLVVSNSAITGGAMGVRLTTTSGRVDASLDHVSIQAAGDGVHAVAGFVNVSNSNISQNTGNGVVADNGAAINVEGSMFTGNGIAAQPNAGGTIRLSNSDFLDNLTGFGCGGGTLATAGNNRKANNVGGGAACSPNATFTVQ
jgi:hypothetical protein